MKNNDLMSIHRLSNSLILDKHFKKDNLSNVLKSEIFKILENYLIIDKDNINLDIEMNSNGYLDILFRAKAKRSKVLGVFPEDNLFL